MISVPVKNIDKVISSYEGFEHYESEIKADFANSDYEQDYTLFLEVVIDNNTNDITHIDIIDNFSLDKRTTVHTLESYFYRKELND